jgi:hypothetical protein
MEKYYRETGSLMGGGWTTKSGRRCLRPFPWDEIIVKGNKNGSCFYMCFFSKPEMWRYFIVNYILNILRLKFKFAKKHFRDYQFKMLTIDTLGTIQFYSSDTVINDTITYIAGTVSVGK